MYIIITLMADVNDHGYADCDGTTLTNLVFDPVAEGHQLSDYQDTCKFSHATNFTVKGCTITGGTENAIDCNRFCENGLVVDTVLIGVDQAAIVVKGGCKNIVFKDVAIAGVKGWCDVLLDDWSDQSQLPSSVTLDNVKRLDGKTVRVVCGRATNLTIINGNCKKMFWLSIGLHVYNWAKGLAIKIGLIKSP